MHLKRLEEYEYLIARRRDGRFVYELMYNGEGQDGAAFVMGLIDPAALGATYDGARSGQEAAQLGEGETQTGQSRVGDGADAGQLQAGETENSAARSSVRAAPPQARAQMRILGITQPVTSYLQPAGRGR